MPPTMPPIAPPERPLEEGAGEGDGDVEADADAEVEGVAPGVVEVYSLRTERVMGYAVAEGLVELRELKVSLRRVAFRGRSGLSKLDQQMLN